MAIIIANYGHLSLPLVWPCDCHYHCNYGNLSLHFMAIMAIIIAILAIIAIYGH